MGGKGGQRQGKTKKLSWDKIVTTAKKKNYDSIQQRIQALRNLHTCTRDAHFKALLLLLAQGQ